MAHLESQHAIRALTRAELQAIDRSAESEYGLPLIVLMENAGRGAADKILAWSKDARAEDARGGMVLVLTGAGNNGGDGCVVARHLANAGVPTELAATHAVEDLHGEHRIMRQVVERMGLVVHRVSNDAELEALAARCASAVVLVDALLGTGFRGDVRPHLARIIQIVNDRHSRASTSGRRVRVAALDLPSGMDCDSGRASRPTIVADLTLTFVARKVGFSAPEAREHLGEVEVVSIGAPCDLIRRVAAAAAEPGARGGS